MANQFDYFLCRKWSTVIGSFLLLNSIGFPWYWGTLSVYIDSYVIKNVDKHAEVQSPWTMACFAMGSCLGLLLSVVSSRFAGKRISMILGILVFNSSLLLAYFLVDESPFVMHILIGTFCALGLFLIEGVILSLTVEWATGDLGFIGGIIQSGAACCAIWMNQVITLYINPTNLSPDVTVQSSKLFSQSKLVDKVPSMLLIIIAVAVTGSVVAMALVRENPNKSQEYQNLDETHSNEQTSMEPSTLDASSEHDKGSARKKSYHSTETTSALSTSPHPEKPSPGLSSAETLPKSVSYLLCLFTLCGQINYLLVTNYYKSYGQVYISDDHFTTNISIPMIIIIIISRICWGRFLDKFKIKKTFLAYFACCAVASLLVYFSPIVDKWCYLVAILVFAAVGNPCYNIISCTCMILFGHSSFLLKYALIMLPTNIIILALSSSFVYLMDAFGWFSIYCLCSSFNLISLIACMTMFPDKS